MLPPDYAINTQRAPGCMWDYVDEAKVHGEVSIRMHLIMMR